LYFWAIAPRSGLGRDGHSALGGFLPPVCKARRMWAGSRVRFPRPLLATLMVGLAARSWPERQIASFEFRGQRPIIDTDPFKVCASLQDDTCLDLWVTDASGWLAMKGSAEFRARA
jgi:hydroxyacyl-ACP dehydratase HTD2-like protein with hotdog domain